MGLIVDAYNVLHCTHTLPEPYATMSATRMCELLDESRWASGRIAVVCDGLPKPDEGEYHGGVRLIYSGPGTDADSIIEDLIARDDGPRELTVVSNDRRLQAAAKRRRARPMPAAVFLKQLMIDIKRDDTAGPSADMPDTDAWLREFGFDQREDDLR